MTEEEAAALLKGAKWGAVVGFVIGSLYMGENSPLGFYTGSVGLVFVTCIGIGTAIGAGLVWLGQKR